MPAYSEGRSVNAFAVCGIGVTYNPDIALLHALAQAALPQLDSLLVVDNGSNDASIAWLRTLAQQTSAMVVEAGRNLGIGAAQNLGICWAKARGFSHVLLLDQDSVPGANMVRCLREAMESLIATRIQPAAVGPRYRDLRTGFASYFVRFGWMGFSRIHCEKTLIPVVQADFLISSGLLISLAVLDQIGAMDEQLFIGHVDTEWFLRARAKGLRPYGVCRAVMQHGLGEGAITIKKLGRFPQYPPLRHYYVFRNSLLVYRRDYAPWKWILNDLLKLSVTFVLYALTVSPRWQHLAMMIRGIRDGLRGIAGPAPACVEYLENSSPTDAL
jgi:rhamnosyltransferase